MLLILLKDNTFIEVPQCTDVVHKLTFLLCVDALDAPLLCLPADEVLGYTMNRTVAAHIIDGAEGSAPTVR